MSWDQKRNYLLSLVLLSTFGFKIVIDASQLSIIILLCIGVLAIISNIVIFVFITSIMMGDYRKTKNYEAKKQILDIFSEYINHSKTLADCLDLIKGRMPDGMKQ